MDHTGINAQDLGKILSFVAEAVAREESRLNSLDSAIGDGDHGITMRLGFQAIKTRVGGLPEGTGLDAIIGEAGRAFMGATGGAIGIILGKMFMAGRPVLTGRDIMGASEFLALLKAMESAVATTGKAQPGDKTILDALHAAQESAARAVVAGKDLVETVAQAAGDAEAAAQQTANIMCRVGRASKLGERTLGHPDPGAVSFGIILRAISDWLQQNSVRPAS